MGLGQISKIHHFFMKYDDRSSQWCLMHEYVFLELGRTEFLKTRTEEGWIRRPSVLILSLATSTIVSCGTRGMNTGCCWE